MWISQLLFWRRQMFYKVIIINKPLERFIFPDLQCQGFFLTPQGESKWKWKVHVFHHSNTPGPFLPFSSQILPPAAPLGLQLNTLNSCCSLTWQTGVAFLYFLLHSSPFFAGADICSPYFCCIRTTNQYSKFKPFWRILPGRNQQNSSKSGKFLKINQGKASARSQDGLGRKGP